MAPKSASEDRLRAALPAIGPLTETEIVLPRSGRSSRIVYPTDLDALLDRAAGDPEQNLPYWAEIWPSGLALADAIHERSQAMTGGRVLELGSGLGVTAIAALRHGSNLVVADYAAEALALCRYNTLVNVGRVPDTLQVNWRAPGDALFAASPGGFPVVLAADVLYESRDFEPLLDLLGRLVAPGGLLWLAEPGRPPARRFLDAARALGWHGASDRHDGPWPDPADSGVSVGVHRLHRPQDSNKPRH